jgi:hypothetical protein
MTAHDPFVIRLGDDFADRPPMVKVFPIDRRGDRTCRLGVRAAGDGIFIARAHVDLTAEQLRDLAAALTERADAIDGGTPRPEHDQQAAPTATTGGA